MDDETHHAHHHEYRDIDGCETEIGVKRYGEFLQDVKLDRRCEFGHFRFLSQRRLRLLAPLALREVVENLIEVEAMGRDLG
jgi:hypothetical protein